MLVMINLTALNNQTKRITTSFPRLTYTLSGRGMNTAHLNQWS
jgi:hypothetical protein